ncbi:hypothetical protein FSP39_004800 [Pinctada imbricata]|uniref:Apolipoprotein L3 n=1 Tax=Pinctada imbricata TaxID=66713 RepID=A0AA88Y974_PINIB|nr:hypothetical protein FSP39_004800 [Pinctada imbricata]
MIQTNGTDVTAHDEMRIETVIIILWAAGGVLLMILLILLVCILKNNKKSSGICVPRERNVLRIIDRSHMPRDGRDNHGYSNYDDIWTWIPIIRGGGDTCTRAGPDSRVFTTTSSNIITENMQPPPYSVAISTPSEHVPFLWRPLAELPLHQEHVNMESTDDNVLCYLQRVSDWTKITVYLLSADCDGYYSWQATNPTEHSDKRCRYYITILKHGRYFDRVIPKRGCNCQLASPLFDMTQEPQNITNKLVIPKEERHLPMVTFVPSDPCEDDFEDEKRRLPIYSPLSEIRHIGGRFDMKERCIDASSDYTYSLYRCISKEIFGTEKHFYSLVEYVVTEVRSNPEHYGKLYQKEGRSKLKDVFKFDSTIEKENADYYADRIEDGLNLEDLELFAVATFLQTPIFVLIIDDNGTSRWIEYTQTRRIRRPVHLEQRKFQSKCQRKLYFVTMFRTSFGQYHRIVPMNANCNCLLEKPTELEVQIETLYVRQDNDAIQFTTRYREIESRLRAVEIALDKWNRSVITLEAFCEGVIVELEQVRHNVNIASIVGSSVGFIGASLALAGVIAAPFTFGTSLGLTIAGGVIGGAGGLTSVGSKFTEVALNKKPMDQLTRREMVLAERAVELRTCLSNLEESIEKCQDDIKPPSFDELHAIEAQALPGLLRMIKAFTILPVMVLRSASRVAVICATILGPLSAVLDIGIGTFAVYNLVKGSKTSITENLRKVSVFLRSMRIQMQIWRYGTETR